MPQIQQVVARLRLLLADIEARNQQLQLTHRQFRAQLDRLHQQVVHGRIGLEAALAIIAELEERLASSEALQSRLEAIQTRVRRELEALLLLQQVEEARERLAALRERSQAAGEGEGETLAEIRRLEEFIAENSQRAGRAITSGR